MKTNKWRVSVGKDRDGNKWVWVDRYHEDVDHWEAMHSFDFCLDYVVQKEKGMKVLPFDKRWVIAASMSPDEWIEVPVNE